MKKIESFEPSIITPTDNLSKHERIALNELKNNNDIIIKKADKGGSIVIMDTDYYRDHLVLDGHLNSNTYSKVDPNCDKTVIKNLETHIKKFQECLTAKEVDYLTNFEWKSSNFYVTPKVHKCKSIADIVKINNNDYIELLRPTDLKSRPIVAGCVSPTQRLSTFINILLSPIVPHLTTYIKDDWHFLKQLPHTMDFNNTTLYSVDITSLYTSIPHDLGIDAIRYWITKYRHLIPQRFTEAFIIESLSFVLKNNNFKFDGNYYKQESGTAMGTVAAPTYACLVIGYLEEIKLFRNILPRHFNNEQCNYLKEHFKRYMDDGFSPIRSDIDIDLFLHCLNSQHPNIKYTEEIATFVKNKDEKYQKLNFLDITVILHDNNSIETDIFYKSTNAHDYLNYHSHHEDHIKRNIPFNLAKRIICFVSDSNKMILRLKELRNFLKSCDYPEHVIERGIFNAKLQGPAPQKQLTSNCIPLITTNYSNIDLKPVMTKAKQELINACEEEESLKEIFNDCRFFIAKRQPKNLLRILSPSQFSSTTNSTIEPTITKCKDKRCKICLQYLQTTTKFKLASGKEWSVKCNMSCNSKNVIYFLKCNKCNTTSYIGKTNNLRKRTNQHISTCRTGNGTDKFDQHVYHCNKESSNEPYFKLYLMIELKDPNLLLTYESHFHQLKYDTLNR